MTLQDTFGYGFVNYFAGLGKKPNTSELLSSNCDYRVEKFGYKIPGGKEIREFFELDEPSETQDPATDWPNPPADHPGADDPSLVIEVNGTGSTEGADEGGCNAGSTSHAGWLALTALLMLGLWRRRPVLS